MWTSEFTGWPSSLHRASVGIGQHKANHARAYTKNSFPWPEWRVGILYLMTLKGLDVSVDSLE